MMDGHGGTEISAPSVLSEAHVARPEPELQPLPLIHLLVQTESRRHSVQLRTPFICRPLVISSSLLVCFP